MVNSAILKIDVHTIPQYILVISVIRQFWYIKQDFIQKIYPMKEKKRCFSPEKTKSNRDMMQ